MGFNCNTIRAFDIKLIFSDSVGLGKEYRIYETKAPWVYAHTHIAFYANWNPASFSSSRIRDWG